MFVHSSYILDSWLDIFLFIFRRCISHRGRRAEGPLILVLEGLGVVPKITTVWLGENHGLLHAFGFR